MNLAMFPFIFFVAVVGGTFYYFHEMAPWQKIGFLAGTAIGLFCFLFAFSLGLLFLTALVLVVSCAQVWVEFLNLRSG